MSLNEQNRKELSRSIHDVVNNASDYETNVYVNIKQRRTALLPAHVQVFQEIAILVSIGLSGRACKVLLYFFGKQGYENYLGLDIETIMHDLTMSKPTVVNALKELCDANVILKLANPADKRRHDYFVNPIQSWKGNSIQRQKRINEFNKEQLALKFDS
jgi:DNA-binding MarR family transcriptional regulator